MSGKHAAAILPAKGSALEVTQLETPTPGPNEVLVEVSAIAFNPLDCLQQSMGFMVGQYPAVLGSDIAGTVVSAGKSVGSDVAQAGTRVAGFASTFYKQGEPKYGAMQKRVLMPEWNLVPLPSGISFNDAALLPMQVSTTFGGWYTMGVARDTAYTPADKKGMLIWGAASSIGTGAVQSARLMGFHIYATASPKHHDYLKSLGAGKVFDYKDDNVVADIVKAAKADGVTLDKAYHATGDLVKSMQVVREFRADGSKALVASAPPMYDGPPNVEGAEAIFLEPPSEPEARDEQFRYVFRVWLKEKLESGEFVPTPKVEVVGKGLEYADKAIEQLRAGVNGVKLVIEV